MRKWFWCCTAAGVVAASIFGSAKFCSSHPDAMFTKVVASACEIGLRSTPFSGLQSSPVSTTDGTPDETRSCPAEQACDDKFVEQIELPGNRFELPVPIVIREDDDLKEPEAIVQQPADGENLAAGFFDSTIQHQRMPYADADETPVAVMPYAVEDAFAEVQVDACHATGFWGQLFGQTTCGSIVTVEAAKVDLPVETSQHEEGCPTLSLWRRFVQALKGEDVPVGETEEAEPKEPSEPMKEESREDAHYYHDHYQSCPRGAYPCPGQSYYPPRLIPIEEPKTEPNKSSEEESEPAKPAKVGKSESPIRSFDAKRELLQSRPLCPRIDTMEFRSSDHALDEYEQVPDSL